MTASPLRNFVAVTAFAAIVVTGCNSHDNNDHPFHGEKKETQTIQGKQPRTQAPSVQQQPVARTDPD
jgi:hypothetical protein